MMTKHKAMHSIDGIPRSDLELQANRLYPIEMDENSTSRNQELSEPQGWFVLNFLIKISLFAFKALMNKTPV